MRILSSTLRAIWSPCCLSPKPRRYKKRRNKPHLCLLPEHPLHVGHINKNSLNHVETNSVRIWFKNIVTKATREEFIKTKLPLNQNEGEKQETNCSTGPISSQDWNEQDGSLWKTSIWPSHAFIWTLTAALPTPSVNHKSLQWDSSARASSNKQSVSAQSLQLCEASKVHRFAELYRRHAAGSKAGVVKFM